MSRHALPDVRIAVVIVCRNALAALRLTLDSLQALADPRVLTIVVDGASHDGTPQLLAARRESLFAMTSEPDRGIYDAMNKGWRMAPPSAYVLYLGAGDTLVELPPTSELCDPQGQPWPVIFGFTQIGKQPFQSRWGQEMRLRNTAHHQSLMILKAIHPEPPFDPMLKVYADWDFNLRLLRRDVQARCSDHLRAAAEPGGVSWHHDLSEIRSVATRHGGPLIGLASWALNRASRWRRRHAER